MLQTWWQRLAGNGRAKTQRLGHGRVRGGRLLRRRNPLHVEALEERALLALNVGPNVNIGKLPGNQNEGSLAINPTNPNQIVAFSNDEAAAGGVRAYVSKDAGVTWSTRLITNGDNIGVSGCCDAQAAWDNFGNLFMTYIDFGSSDFIKVVMSTDGGTTFSLIGTIGSNGVDQPSIAVGAGSVWVDWNQGGSMVAAGAPVTGLGAVGAFSAPEAAPNGVGSFGGIAVGPAGQVMIVYQNPTGGQGPATISANVDPDGLGPAGFGPQITITNTNVGGFDYIPPQAGRSVDAEANLAWDRSNNSAHKGRVYLVYTDEFPDESNDTDIFVRYSDDNGTSWTNPTRVNDDLTTNSQFNPEMAVDQSTGNLALAWFDSRNAGPSDATAQIYATVSTDGGVTFQPNARVSVGASNSALAAAGTDYGDYMTMDFANGFFYPLWSDNSAALGGNPNLPTLDMATARVGIVGGGITGQVFQDVNGNGVKNAGDTGLSGWTVFIDANKNGNLDGNEVSTTTDGLGNYSFSGLNPGTYRIRELIPTGWTNTTTPFTDVTVANAVATGINFGDFKFGTLKGQIFLDDNGNGARDLGEGGLLGWNVDLIDASTNLKVANTSTDAQGNYTFNNLGPGAFRVRQTVQTGWQQINGNPADFVTLSGGGVTGLTFGNFQTAVISGQVFEDRNADGVNNGTEPGLSGWTVQLLNANTGAVIVTQLTDGSGLFSMTAAPGAYRLREIAPAGWSQTTVNPRDVYITTSGTRVLNLSFGNFQLATISGAPFQDTNGNGVRDFAEPALSGWTVQLFNATTGALLATQATDLSGAYAFTNLGPGSYRVRQVLPLGWTQTTSGPADIANTTSGAAFPNVDLGAFQTVTVAGTVYLDDNGNGTKDPEDTGLEGWTVQLQDQNGVVLQTALTDSDGSYAFTGVGAGTDRVREVAPASWLQTTANPAAFPVLSGQSHPGVDFGNLQLSSISGRVFEDVAEDGTFNGADAGLAGWSVQLSDAGSGLPLQSATTDGSGAFTFAGLPLGSYRIRETAPAGWSQSTPNPADVVISQSGTQATGVSIGNFHLASVSGVAFEDKNGDGTQAGTDPAASGRTVQLLDASNNVVTTTTTSGTGAYSFTGLHAGTYHVLEVAQAGWLQTTANPPAVSLISGSAAAGGVFGSFQTVKVGGLVFQDVSGNGQKDGGDTGAGGLTVQLLGAGGAVVQTTTTTAVTGTYAFTGVGPGTYHVHVVLPGGTLQTTPNPADVATASGSDVTETGVGTFRLAALSGRVFDDLDADGTSGGGTEPGLGGFTLQLFKDTDGNGRLSAADQLVATTTSSAGGQYAFSGVGPGSYLATEVKQKGKIQTSPAGGTFGFTATSGASAAGNDFGNIGDPNRSFVYQAYLDLLHRRVDAAGLKTYATYLSQGGSRAAVVKALQNSAEFRTAQVQGLYQSILGRAADPVGLKNAVNLLLNTPYVPGSDDPLVQLKANLYGSAEYFQRKGGTNSGFLAGLYQDILGRPIDAAGALTYGTALANGSSRTLVAKTLLYGNEALTITVNGFYQTYLRRAGDAAGLAKFVTDLRNGKRQDDVVAALMASDEYFGRL